VREEWVHPKIDAEWSITQLLSRHLASTVAAKH